MTIFLSIPSKLIGIAVGFFEYYIYVFIILYVLSIPIFNLNLINDSKIANTILDNTPILSNMVGNTVSVYTEIWNIIKTREEKTNKEVNTLVLVTLLDNDLITIESARKLVNTNKIIIEDQTILDNYQSDGDLYDKLKERYYNE